MSGELARIVTEHTPSLTASEAEKIIECVNRWITTSGAGIDSEALIRNVATDRYAFSVAIRKVIAQAALELMGEIALARSMR